MKRIKRSDALREVYRRFFDGKPERLAELEDARASAAVARQVYALRTRAHLTQAALAERVGTTKSVISRMEHDDYTGHSLPLLRRIAAACGRRVEIRFVKSTAKRTAA